VLGALVLYTNDGEQSAWRKNLRRAGLMAAATVAVFSKESGVMVLALAILYDFTYRTRRGASLRELAAGFRRFFWEGYVYLALPVIAMLCVRWLVLRQDGAMEVQFVDNPIFGAGFLVGRATAIGVIGRYFGLLAWPQWLACDYSYNQIPLFHWHSMTWREWSSVAAVAGLLALWAFCYRRGRTGFFLLGFSALTILPSANLLVTTGTVMAERLLYLPAVGFAAALAIGICRLAQRLGFQPMVAVVALGAIGLAYGARTYQRNFDWEDGQTLYGSAAEISPASFRPHLSLAQGFYALDPRFLEGDKAITEAETAAQIVAGLPVSETPAAILSTLGKIYTARGDQVAAKDANGKPYADAASAGWYGKALDAELRAVQANRAWEENRLRVEVARGRRAGDIRPSGLPEVDVNLGQVYLRLRDPQLALQAFLDLRRLQPSAPVTYALISEAYQSQNKTAEAASAMLESFVLSQSISTLSRVAQLYDKVDGGSCVTEGRAEFRTLNHGCAVLQRDLCNSYGELAHAAQDSKQPSLAQQFRDAGRGLPGCQVQ
jgi:tetratricopeptide (TPR) repeat protein